MQVYTDEDGERFVLLLSTEEGLASKTFLFRVKIELLGRQYLHMMQAERCNFYRMHAYMHRHIVKICSCFSYKIFI